MTTRALYFSDGNRAMMLVGRSLLFRSKYASGVVSPSDTSSGNPTSVARAFTVPFFSWLRITRLSLTKDFSLLSYVPAIYYRYLPHTQAERPARIRALLKRSA